MKLPRSFSSLFVSGTLVVVSSVNKFFFFKDRMINGLCPIFRIITDEVKTGFMTVKTAEGS